MADCLEIQVGLEWYIYLYVVGMAVERYIVFSRQGFRVHFQFWWRWFDFLLIGSFLLSLFFWATEQIAPQDPPLVNRKHLVGMAGPLPPTAPV